MTVFAFMPLAILVVSIPTGIPYGLALHRKKDALWRKRKQEEMEASEDMVVSTSSVSLTADTVNSNTITADPTNE